MGSGPSENKGEGGSLDLNSSASEQLETLVEERGKEDEKKAAEAELGAEHGGIDKGGSGGEVKTAVEAETPVADTDVVAERSPEIGSLEAGGDGGGGDRVVSGQGSGSKRRRGRPRRSSGGVPNEKANFAVSDLVWGKVRSHPWWPAQIFDPSDASEMAESVRKKDHYLVAYYGDQTFAWCDESQLKPFRTYFSQMEKQNTMEAFVTAVNAALQDVSRRVELGLTCHCFRDETFAALRDQKFENTGVREGRPSYAADQSSTAASFDPLSLIDYLQSLAESPYGEVDKLNLAITKSQLTAFYRSKGYSELPAFVVGEELGTNIEDSPLEKTKSGKEVGDPSSPSSSLDASRKGKSGSSGSPVGKEKRVIEYGRKRKSLSKLMETEGEHHDADSKKSGSGEDTKHSSGRKQEIDHLDVADSGKGKNKKLDNLDAADSGKGKKKKLDSLGDLVNKSQTLNSEKQSMFGERMSRVAGLLTGSPSVLKPNGETTTKSSTKLGKRKGDMGNDVRATNNESKDNSPGEMLSRLCSVAKSLREHDDKKNKETVVRNATDSKSSATVSGDKKHTEAVAGKRGRRKSTNVKSASSEMTTSDHMKEDEGCSDIADYDGGILLSVQNSKGEPKKKQQKRHQRTDEEAPSLPLLSMSDTGQNSQDSKDNSSMLEAEGVKVIGETTKETANRGEMGEYNDGLQKEVEECMPTALVLTFGEQDAIPAEADLVKIFGQYGPLRDSETEVLKSENRAKVVFKRRSDAEVALSSAGKHSILGHTLVSYKLRFLESSTKASPTRIQDALPAEAGSNTNISVQEDGGAISDKMHVDANGLAA